MIVELTATMVSQTQCTRTGDKHKLLHVRCFTAELAVIVVWWLSFSLFFFVYFFFINFDLASAECCMKLLLSFSIVNSRSDTQHTTDANALQLCPRPTPGCTAQSPLAGHRLTSGWMAGSLAATAGCCFLLSAAQRPTERVPPQTTNDSGEDSNYTNSATRR